MNIIFDARALRLYPVAGAGFSGGTEEMVRRLARGLAAHHTVHVVAPDLERPEQRGPSEWWWPVRAHPLDADAVVLVHNMEALLRADYNAPLLLVATNGHDPWLGEEPQVTRQMVDGWPVFSDAHKALLAGANPIAVDPLKVFVTGLGIDLPFFIGGGARFPGRLFWASSPERGLWHMLDIFDALKPLVPEASLHVAYDFQRVLEGHRWEASALAERLWECHERLTSTPGVQLLGGLSRGLELQREQGETHVFAYPCDPPTPGSELFCLAAMEAAGNGTPLVLGKNQALPEVFADGALLLPLPGTFIPQAERRYDAQDWAEAIAELMGDRAKWQTASEEALQLASRHTWQAVVERWERMFSVLSRTPEESSGRLAHLEDQALYERYYNAESYHAFMPMFKDEPRLMWALARIGETDDVLDLGCHFGEMTRHIRAKTSGRVVGVDLSEEAIRVATREHEGIEWLQCWAENVPLPDDSFDVVVVCEVLEHVMNPDAVLREAERLVRDGGRVVISVPAEAAKMGEGEAAQREIATGLALDAHVREWLPAVELLGKPDLELDEGTVKEVGFTFRLACYSVRKTAVVAGVG